MLAAVLCIAVFAIGVGVVLGSRSSGPLLGVMALVMRVVYLIPGVRKPPELRIAKCVSELASTLSESAPSVRSHHAQRSKRDRHLHVSFICGHDADVPTARSTHGVLLDALRHRMRAHDFSEQEIAGVQLDFVSQEEIDRLGGSFHYWRERGAA